MKFTLKLFFLIVITHSSYSFSQANLPNINIKSSSGRVINIKEFSSDKIIILNFWATWCVPCINELNNINEVYTDWQKETGLALIAISIDDSRSLSRVIPLSNGYGWNYQILFDENEDLKRALNIYSIPYTIALDNGKIFYRHSGYKEGDEYILINKVKEHLQENN